MSNIFAGALAWLYRSLGGAAGKTRVSAETAVTTVPDVAEPIAREAVVSLPPPLPIAAFGAVVDLQDCGWLDEAPSIGSVEDARPDAASEQPYSAEIHVLAAARPRRSMLPQRIASSVALNAPKARARPRAASTSATKPVPKRAAASATMLKPRRSALAPRVIAPVRSTAQVIQLGDRVGKAETAVRQVA
ncbi:MAG: hypothetical protein AB7O57_11195 [Hyphomicrobiaceae bacterium]